MTHVGLLRLESFDWPSSEEVRLWRDKSSRPASCSLKHLLVVVFVVFSVGGEGEILP